MLSLIFWGALGECSGSNMGQKSSCYNSRKTPPGDLPLQLPLRKLFLLGTVPNIIAVLASCTCLTLLEQSQNGQRAIRTKVPFPASVQLSVHLGLMKAYLLCTVGLESDIPIEIVSPINSVRTVSGGVPPFRVQSSVYTCRTRP